MKQFASLSPKTRNERRGVVKMFLQWAVERDYLAPTHRLFESGALKMDSGDDDGEIEVYSAEDLKAILDRASRAPHPPAKEGEQPEANYRHLLPVLSLAGLAGLRLKEAMRLTFEEVFKRPDHLELTKTKSKTRSRRLIPICPALSSWLEYCRGQTGPIWSKSYDMFHLDFAALRKELEIESRHNGLRHSFISAHFAAYSDENLTAAQAGNSPAMIHSHYKGLLTKKEGEAWFAVAPEQPANVIPLAASPDN
jgi:integrase